MDYYTVWRNYNLMIFVFSKSRADHFRSSGWRVPLPSVCHTHSWNASPYLRRTVNLLPFLLSFLCSLFLAKCSLETKRQDQEDDGDLLNTHSGVNQTCGIKDKSVEDTSTSEERTLMSIESSTHSHVKKKETSLLGFSTFDLSLNAVTSPLVLMVHDWIWINHNTYKQMVQIPA